MTIDISTPTLLFSAITLLMLAYSNRFLAIASVVRHFHSRYKETPDLILSLLEICVSVDALNVEQSDIENEVIISAPKLLATVSNQFWSWDTPELMRPKVELFLPLRDP